MSKKAGPLVGVVVAVAYVALIWMFWTAFDVDYETVADTTRGVVRGLLIPVGVGALLIAAVTSWLGWWRPVISQSRLGVPRWTVAVPVLMGVVALGNAIAADYAAVAPSLVASLALGVLLVGFNEEMIARGIALTGFRSRWAEPAAWFASSLLFGAMHSVNALFGQSIGQTLTQVVLTFLYGSVYYVARMATGSLVAAIILHALWDFGTLLPTSSADVAQLLHGLGSVANLPLALLGLMAAIATARSVQRSSRDQQPVAA